MQPFLMKNCCPGTGFTPENTRFPTTRYGHVREADLRVGQGTGGANEKKACFGGRLFADGRAVTGGDRGMGRNDPDQDSWP